MFPLGEIASLATALCWAVGLNLFRRDTREIGARQVNLFKVDKRVVAQTRQGEVGQYEVHVGNFGQGVTATTAVERIIAGTSPKQVIVRACYERVVSCTALQGHRPKIEPGSIQVIVSHASRQHGAVDAIERVNSVAAEQRVGEGEVKVAFGKQQIVARTSL